MIGRCAYPGDRTVGVAPVHQDRRGRTVRPRRGYRDHALPNRGQNDALDAIRNETLPRFLRYQERSEGLGFWAAVEKSTGAFLVWFAFHTPEGADSDEVDLGHRMRRSAWGKGYATEGSRGPIRKGFTQLGMQRVMTEKMAVNAASRRVMENAGLTHTRTFRREWA